MLSIRKGHVTQIKPKFNLNDTLPCCYVTVPLHTSTIITHCCHMRWPSPRYFLPYFINPRLCSGLKDRVVPCSNSASGFLTGPSALVSHESCYHESIFICIPLVPHVVATEPYSYHMELCLLLIYELIS